MSSTSNFKIIEFEDKYARDTVKMWRDSKERALGTKDPHEFDNQLEFLRMRLSRTNKVYLAIQETTDTVIGMLALDGSELNQLYIHNDFQRAGIGTALLELAKQLSPAKLQLYTFEINRTAQAFYEKHGFRIIGRGYENVEGLADIRYEWIDESPKLQYPEASG
jgi:ribosomal protein S18 acetylase RimI-like enzyme